MARPAARKCSRRRARSGSRVAHWERSPGFPAAAKPGHRCFDQKYPREPEWIATIAPVREAVEVIREMRATAHILLCSARPGSRLGRPVFGYVYQDASRRIDTRRAPDRGLGRHARFPGGAIRHGREPAILGG